MATPLPDLDADLLCLVHDAAGDAPPWAGAFDGALEQARTDATAGKTMPLYPPTGPTRVAILALGKQADRKEKWRRVGTRAAKTSNRFKAETVVLDAPDAEAAEAMLEGFHLGAYRFDRYRTTPNAPPEAIVTVRLPDGETADLDAARIRAEATNAARDLVNTSPHDKSPEKLAETMREGAEAVGLRVEVWEEERIREEQMGGLLAVNQGSLDPPRMVVLEHAPPDRGPGQAPASGGEAPVVFVGKGVIYDTGGLSLKPTKNSMDKMKADMGGAAAVYGAMLALARLEVPIRVMALIPMTDNRPGVRAYVPGDVVTMHSGATVEVMNTDAEGRMLLADGLSLAKRYEPRLAVSVATLTGAQGVALGERVGALVTRHDNDMQAHHDLFTQAGEASGDTVWPLPLFPHYKAQLKSPVADMQNVGGRMAGTITAAAFLEHFTREKGNAAYPWAHLDIARPSFLDKPYGVHPKGASGFGVRLLVDAMRALADA